MSVWGQLKHGLRVLAHRKDSDQAVIDEAEDFIDRRAEEFITQGLSPEEARRANNDQAVENVETLEEIKSQSVAPALVRTVLLTIFAGIAVLLAAVGIYGVVSYSVSRRVREMAIRRALGASPGDLLKLVVGKAMLLVLAGLALGSVAALALTRVLTSLLYDTSPTDPMTWVVAGTLLVAVALSACYFPAWRVAKVDPLTILHDE